MHLHGNKYPSSYQRTPFIHDDPSNNQKSHVWVYGGSCGTLKQTSLRRSLCIEKCVDRPPGISRRQMPIEPYWSSTICERSLLALRNDASRDAESLEAEQFLEPEASKTRPPWLRKSKLSKINKRKTKASSYFRLRYGVKSTESQCLILKIVISKTKPDFYQIYHVWVSRTGAVKISPVPHPWMPPFFPYAWFTLSVT